MRLVQRTTTLRSPIWLIAITLLAVNMACSLKHGSPDPVANNGDGKPTTPKPTDAATPDKTKASDADGAGWQIDGSFSVWQGKTAEDLAALSGFYEGTCSSQNDWPKSKTWTAKPCWIVVYPGQFPISTNFDPTARFSFVSAWKNDFLLADGGEWDFRFGDDGKAKSSGWGLEPEHFEVDPSTRAFRFNNATLFRAEFRPVKSDGSLTIAPQLMPQAVSLQADRFARSLGRLAQMGLFAQKIEFNTRLFYYGNGASGEPAHLSYIGPRLADLVTALADDPAKTLKALTERKIHELSFLAVEIGSPANANTDISSWTDTSEVDLVESSPGNCTMSLRNGRNVPGAEAARAVWGDATARGMSVSSIAMTVCKLP